MLDLDALATALLDGRTGQTVVGDQERDAVTKTVNLLAAALMDTEGLTRPDALRRIVGPPTGRGSKT